MRFNRYLREENALKINEPEVGIKYTEDEVSDNIMKLKIAIGKQVEIIKKLRNGDGSGYELKAARAVIRDLEDKLDKWENWEEEVKSQGPNPSMEEPPIEEVPKPEEEEPEE